MSDHDNASGAPVARDWFGVLDVLPLDPAILRGITGGRFDRAPPSGYTPQGATPPERGIEAALSALDACIRAEIALYVPAPDAPPLPADTRVWPRCLHLAALATVTRHRALLLSLAARVVPGN